MSILNKNDQKGRSMVEMLGVLAIIGVLSVGGISGYSKAMAKFKLTKAQDQISMLLMNVRTAFATSPSYDGLTNASAVAFAIAPGDMYPGASIPTSYGVGAVTQLNNAFGGGAHVYSCKTPQSDGGAQLKCKAGINSGADVASEQYFAIALTNLGREACVSLASSDWGTDGLLSIQVNGKYFGTEKLPIGMIEAGSKCPGYGERGTIVWTYY